MGGTRVTASQVEACHRTALCNPARQQSPPESSAQQLDEETEEVREKAAESPETLIGEREESGKRDRHQSTAGRKRRESKQGEFISLDSRGHSQWSPPLKFVKVHFEVAEKIWKSSPSSALGVKFSAFVLCLLGFFV